MRPWPTHSNTGGDVATPFVPNSIQKEEHP